MMARSTPAARGRPNTDAWHELHANFRWHVPRDFNIAEVCCARWSRETPDAVAIRSEHEDGAIAIYTYADLQRVANRLSHALVRLGVTRGDRVAIVMPQRFETAVAHIALYQLGAVAVPLSMLFGPDALEYRLNDSAARVAIVDENGIANLLAARTACPGLATVLAAGSAQGQGDRDWHDACAPGPDTFTSAATLADDAAVLIYTSGTTGPPKGALIPHRALIGNLSGFVASQNWFGFDAVDIGPPAARKGERGKGSVSATSRPSPADWFGVADNIGPPSPGKGKQGKGSVSSRPRPRPRPSLGAQQTRSVFWSPADWAWTGGLMDALLPTLYFGREIVAYQGRFSAETAFALMQRHRVTHTFLFPTALKAMMKAVPNPRDNYRLQLRAIMSAGEAVGDAVFAWCRDALGVPVNEMFGQTEVNYIVGNSQARWPARAGSMGRAYPGHRVAVIDDAGNECPRGSVGDVALHRRDIHGHPDPVFFLGYWNNDAATRAKYTGDPADSWCRTGDLAVMDADGYLWYQGRSDDVFKAAGYRIGPSEIENCLVKHAAVANAAVVPKPDAQRGAVVKAFVVLAPGFEASPQLVEELQRHVRGKLAPYEYPKEIEFIDALPMTTTGKVQRRVLRLLEAQRSPAS